LVDWKRGELSKILVADQDKYLSRVLKTSLELDGFKAITASEDDLIKKAESEIPDLIFLGLENSLEICKETRENKIDSFIIISSMQDFSEDFKEFGADGFLQKPYSISTPGKEIKGF
jgi:DNA-binding response OmpR family regulator